MVKLDIYNSHHQAVILFGVLMVASIWATIFSLFFYRKVKTVPSKNRPEKFLIPEDGGALVKFKDEEDQVYLKLAKRIKISEDTLIYRFEFPDTTIPFGLPIGKHVVFTAKVKTKTAPEGEEICRKYTPISPLTDRGFVDFLIKVYRPNIHPKFPDGGMMSQYVDSLKIGETMQMEGPKGRLQYEGFGNFTISKIKMTGKTKIGCIAGGTGITPAYQIIQAVLKNEDTPDVSLVFGNRTTNDILLKKELDALDHTYHDKFKLFYTVDIKPDASEEWDQGVGFITTDMLKKYMPAPGPETLIVYCGPPMFEKDMKSHLKELGYDERTMVFKF